MDKQAAAAKIAELKRIALEHLDEACMLAEDHEIEFEINLTGTAPTTFEESEYFTIDGEEIWVDDLIDMVDEAVDEDTESGDKEEETALRSKYGDKIIDCIKGNEYRDIKLPWTWQRWISSSEEC